MLEDFYIKSSTVSLDGVTLHSRESSPKIGKFPLKYYSSIKEKLMEFKNNIIIFISKKEEVGIFASFSSPSEESSLEKEKEDYLYYIFGSKTFLENSSYFLDGYLEKDFEKIYLSGSRTSGILSPQVKSKFLKVSEVRIEGEEIQGIRMSYLRDYNFKISLLEKIREEITKKIPVILYLYKNPFRVGVDLFYGYSFSFPFVASEESLVRDIKNFINSLIIKKALSLEDENLINFVLEEVEKKFLERKFREERCILKKSEIF